MFEQISACVTAFTPTLPAVFVSAGISLGLFIVMWLVSIRLSDVSFIDAAWGPNISLLALGSVLFAAQGKGVLAWVAPVLALLWGGRLGVFLAIRWVRAGKEDRRYAAMRERFGADTFWWKSLGVVFGLQWILALLLSLQFFVASVSRLNPILVAIGSGVFIVGFWIEAVADEQLRRHKARTAGTVLDTGLWRYSRHPNYFGEMVLWWGLWIASGAAAGAYWTVMCPMLISFLLLKVSGVVMLEEGPGGLKSRKPGYEAYVRRTSKFLPMPPSPNEAVSPEGATR